MNRTGHRSSQMLHRYRRAIDLAWEQALSDLAPMHEPIPELAAVVVADEEGAA